MLECALAYLACFILAISYVGSLYVWSSPFDRDHPSVILKRTISVFIVSLISPLITQQFIYDERFSSFTLAQLLGFRLTGILPALVLPLLLTAILFLGPLCVLFLHPFPEIRLDAVALRNYVIAPLTEELTFRACMLPLLLQCLQPMTAVLVCPLFFGLAHVHHMIERIRQRIPLANVIMITIFQLSYTTLFGAYSGLLFLKTGHFVAPFLAHAFCNLMGFPNFDEVLNLPTPKRYILSAMFVLGVVLWCVLLPSMTLHTIYGNDVYTAIAS